MIVLGDFGQGPDSSDHDLLRKERFQPLVPAHTFTNISTKNPQGSKSLDNIWISKSLRKVFTGNASRPPLYLPGGQFWGYSSRHHGTLTPAEPLLRGEGCVWERMERHALAGNKVMGVSGQTWGWAGRDPVQGGADTPSLGCV